MAFDEGLAQRIRDALQEASDVEEKRMFGGLCFMVSGAMAVGIVRDELMVRLSKEEGASALGEPGTRPMDFTGKALPGFVYVSAEGVADDEALDRWVARAAAHARSLPPKPARPSRPRRSPPR